MPIGTCDPASRGDTWNILEQEIGPILLRAQYGWDGVSVRPDCVGPLNRVQVRNASTTDTWYVWMQGRRGQWRSFELTPGYSNTFNSGQLHSRGLDDNTDLDGLYFTESPNPPSV